MAFTFDTPVKTQAEILQKAADTQAKYYAGRLDIILDNLFMLGLPSTKAPPGPVEGEFDIEKVYSELAKLAESAPLMPDIPQLVGPPPETTIPKLDAPKFASVPPATPAPTAPTFTFRNPPNITSAPFGGTVPVMKEPPVPGRPELPTLPAPTFENIVIPTITDAVFPVFTGVAPKNDFTAPTELFVYAEKPYESALADAATAKLMNDLMSGGYGIEIADEIALWDRARDREIRGADAATAEMSRQMASRGFSLPPGTMLAQLASIQQGVTEKLSTLSRDIALKRGDMYVENRKFTIEQVRQYEKIAVDMHVSLMERTLNAAKAVVELGLAVYNAKIVMFNAGLEEFKTLASVYEAEIRGALGMLEGQKLKLQTVDSTINIQKNKAELYKAELDAQKHIVEMYRVDIEAMKALLGAEGMKFDVFRTEVMAYGEMLKAGTLSMQGYETQMRGDAIRADVYKTLVSAQAIDMERSKTAASIIEGNNKIAIEHVRTAAQAVTAEADVFRSKAQGISANNEANAKAFTARTEAFKALASVYKSIGEIDLSRLDASTRVALENARITVEREKLETDRRVRATIAGSEGNSKAMQAALNQVISIASVTASA